jgi:hypothetical protein
MIKADLRNYLTREEEEEAAAAECSISVWLVKDRSSSRQLSPQIRLPSTLRSATLGLAKNFTERKHGKAVPAGSCSFSVKLLMIN